MRAFLLTLVIIQLINLINCVPDRCGSGVKYSYPGDNTKFIICENHIPLAKKCPVGTTFNQNVQVCDALSNSNSGNVEMVSGSYRTVSYTPNPAVQTPQLSTGQNGGRVNYNSRNYNSPTPSHTDFQGNHIDQSLGTGHNNQHLSGLGQSISHTSSYSGSSVPSSSQSTTNQQPLSGLGQSISHTSSYSGSSVPSSSQSTTSQHHLSGLGQSISHTSSYSGSSVPSSSQSTTQGQNGYGQGLHSQHNGQGLNSGIHSGYSGSSNNVGVSSTSNHLGQSLNNNQHYPGSSQPGYRGVTSGYNNGGLSNKGYGNGYDSQHNAGVKTYHQHNSGIGGGYNDHKNINSDGWLQHQNHGLDHSHINLNEIRGSTGHSANSCNKAAAGDHIAYPGDCTKFIVCMEDGKNVIKDCPPKTHFNPQLQICDWPESAGCVY